MLECQWRVQSYIDHNTIFHLHRKSTIERQGTQDKNNTIVESWVLAYTYILYTSFLLRNNKFHLVILWSKCDEVLLTWRWYKLWFIKRLGGFKVCTCSEFAMSSSLLAQSKLLQIDGELNSSLADAIHLPDMQFHLEVHLWTSNLCTNYHKFPVHMRPNIVKTLKGSCLKIEPPSHPKRHHSQLVASWDNFRCLVLSAWSDQIGVPDLKFHLEAHQ